MQAASQVRRAKLLALRKRRADEASGIVSDEGLAVKRSFRNYDPSTGRERRLAGPNELKHTVENDIHGIQQDTIAQDQLARAQDLDLTNIAPKRPNWDLKRDLDKRLHKLQRRDKQALLILIRQRIQAQQNAANGSDLTAASAEMAASAAADAAAESDSDNEDD